MADEGSVTGWLQGAGRGDPDAIRQLWERYFHRLVHLIRARFPRLARGPRDEEDVALSAFHSFFQGLGRERFPDLHDRQNLWNLLALMARRKAMAYVRHENRQKRGGGKAATGVHEGADLDTVDLVPIPDREPTPELAAEVSDECQRLLALLEDDAIREVALLRLGGFSIEEITEKLDTSRRTVERRLQIIRKKWALALDLTPEE